MGKKHEWPLHATDELRQLIIDNPGLPLLVMAGPEVYSDDYSPGYTLCDYVKASLGEVLDSTDFDDEWVITDRDELEERIRESPDFVDEHSDLSDEEFDKAVEEKMELYDDDWVKAIIVKVDN